jgi:hypothetical protein
VKSAPQIRHTVQLRLRLSPEQETTLSELLAVYSKGKRAAARKRWSDGWQDKEVSPWLCENHGLHSRHGDAIRIALGQINNQWRERQVRLIESAGRRVAYFNRLAHEASMALNEARSDWIKGSNGYGSRSKRIANLKTALFKNNAELNRWSQTLDRLKMELDKGIPKVCFGTARLARERLLVGKKGSRFQTHADWLRAWRDARDGEAWMVGSRAEPFGNMTCRLDPIEKTLWISLTKDQASRNLDVLKASFSKLPSRIPGLSQTTRMIVEGVELPKDACELYEQALSEKRPITTRILRSRTKHGLAFYLHVTFERELATVTIPAKRVGCLGVNFDASQCSWAAVDRFGNPMRESGGVSARGKADWKLNAIAESAADDRMLQEAARLANLAQTMGIPLAIGSENWRTRQAELSEAPIAERLTAEQYSTFNAALRRAALMAGVPVMSADATHAALTGFVKYGAWQGLSVGISAALACARTAMLGQPVAHKKTAKQPKAQSRAKGKKVFVERAVFPRPMPKIEQSIEKRPRGSEWGKLARVLGPDRRRWRACLFPPKAGQQGCDPAVAARRHPGSPETQRPSVAQGRGTGTLPPVS